MGMFDDLIPSQGAPAAAPRAGMFDDLIPAQGSPSPTAPAHATPSTGGFADYATDVGRSVLSGLDRGVAGLAGLPADAARGLAYAADWTKSKATGRPIEEVSAEANARAVISPETLKAWGGQAIHAGSGLAHEPQTQTGRFAQTAAEFVPAALLGPTTAAGALRSAAMYGVAPGLASEGAGQAAAVVAPSLETAARIAAGVGVGGGAAFLTRQNPAERIVARATEGVTPAQMEAAEALMRDAAVQGVQLTRAEAFQQVAGPNRLGDIQRVIEGQGGLREMMAQRPQQVEAAGRRALNDLAPPISAPSVLSQELQEAGRAAVARTPEAQAMEQARWAVGPRVTPEEAGRVIQPELRQVYERREGMRAALGDQDYTAARNAPATIPLDGGYGVRNVTSHYDRPGPGIYLDPAERAAATEQWMAANNPTEAMPVIGLKPTRFGQADVTTVLEHLDEALATSKGSVRQGLEAAKRALYTPAGELDTTVAGLHGSRTAIMDLIDQAKRAGANGAVRELEGALGTLDQALERVPAYGQARRHFAAASEPLASFGESRAPGRIVERDQYGKEFVLPAERAPAAIDQGPSAARDFREVASGPAREAYEGHLSTRMLDSATDGAGNVSSDALRRVLRDNEDVLRQFPAVRDRLQAVAIARDGLARVEQTIVGKLASQPDVRKAITALFPTNPVPGSAGEVLDAVSALARSKPVAARQLVRAHAESVFNEATQALQGGANQFGGATFAAVIRGNRQQAENLAAAIKGLPNGDQILPGFDRFLDIMQATGQRQRIGSQTAFNAEILSEMKGGALGGTIGASAAGGFTQVPRKVMQRFEDWNAGRNVDQIARMLTDPDAASLFRHLANSPPTSAKAMALVGRLSAIGARGSAERPQQR